MAEPADDGADLREIATPAELAARLEALLVAGSAPVRGGDLRALDRDIQRVLRQVRAAFGRARRRHSRALLARQYAGLITHAEAAAARRAYVARQACEQERHLAPYAALAARVARLRAISSAR